MITLHDFTVERIPGVAKTATVFGHTTDPGVLAVTYPTGITGPATVTVAGTRTWRNGLKHGQYLAREGASTASRLGVSFCIEIDQGVLQQSVAAGANAFTVAMIASNLRTDVARRINWKFVLHLYRSANNAVNYRFAYVQSASSSSAEAVYLGPDNALAAPTVDRYIVTLPADTVLDGNVYFYNTTGTAADVTRARGATSGTMGGTEAVVINLPCKISKYDRMLNQSDREGFCQAGTLPATPAWSVQGGHEILPATPRFYDTSGNALDLSDVDVTYWPEAAASGDYTDTGFTSPAFSIPLTIAADCAAGDHVITIRRARVGIPSRTPPLSDAELYDDGSVVVTVSDIATVVKCGPSQDLRARV